MPLPDKYKERGAAMAQAFRNVMGFSIGGRIFDRLKKKKISELISEAREAKKDPLGLVKDKSVGDIADMVKFSKGGRISMFAGIPINPAFARGGADSVIRSQDERASTGPGPYVPFRRGGKIRKGSPAMKRKMARLRAMRK